MKKITKTILPSTKTKIAANRTVIEFINFNLTLGTDVILKDINFKINKRQIIAIIGPSGSGKSSLIRSLNRMNEFRDRVQTSGQILFNGKSIYGRSFSTLRLRSTIGIVFQKPSPFALSIFENIAYGLDHRYRLHHSEKIAIINQALMDVELWEKFGNQQSMPALKLSGGEQQRLCIARAVALQPKVLLLDEPTSSLDPASRWKIERTIRNLSRKMLIILVTHDLEQTRRLAEYVYFLHQGQIVEAGPTEAVLNHPRHERTKKFMKRYKA